MAEEDIARDRLRQRRVGLVVFRHNLKSRHKLYIYMHTAQKLPTLVIREDTKGTEAVQYMNEVVCTQVVS